MSRSLNKVILIGNVGADPEIRTTAGGSRVAQINVATSRRWTNQTGEQQEKTEWHRIVAWERANAGGGDPFNVIERYVKKGDKLYVEGEIEYRSYEAKDGSGTRYITEIRPRDLLMLGSPQGGSGGHADSGQQRERATAGTPAKGDYDDFQAPPLEEEDDLPF